jgi:hypothetical protein
VNSTTFVQFRESIHQIFNLAKIDQKTKSLSQKVLSYLVLVFLGFQKVLQFLPIILKIGANGYY